MPAVQLIYRKPRYTGNFSIETSFRQMEAAFPKGSPFQLQRFVSAYYSNGILPRLQAVREASRLRADIFHITGDVHYLALGLPGARTILTVHDCGFMDDFSGPQRLFLKTFWLDLPARRCRMITAVSEATKRDIIRYTGCPEEKITVIPTIVSPHFQRSPYSFHAERPTVLHIGMAPNKNFERHVQALAGLNCRLHIIGKLEPLHIQKLEQYRIDYSNAYNIDDEAMQQAYENCDLLLFASTLEGFGMPILEAQAVGRPVITSNISSMPEVAGKAAVLVNPLDIQDIRKAILSILGNKEFREELVKKGHKNLKRYHAGTIAEQYLGLYREIHRQNP